jgi:hypothetical protein
MLHGADDRQSWKLWTRVDDKNVKSLSFLTPIPVSLSYIEQAQNSSIK